jgi:hypothetical protein
MIGDRTYRFLRETFGTLQHKNIYSVSFGYTETRKKVSAGSTTAVLAATSVVTTAGGTTITSGFTNPDVPRALSVTIGGTAASVPDGDVIVTGTNIEGKTITSRFTLTAGATGTINGVLAFKSVTRVFVPQALGSGMTVAVGTRNVLGVNHRLFRNNTTVKVYSATAVGVGSYTSLTLQAQPTVTYSEDQLERNTVAPATTPDGTTFYIIAYVFDNWALAPINDEPEYSTSTSTSSTSSSTSTTTATTTSTSSTSSSTSSTSSSTSSTSSSTSSTSTSTTTAP